MHRQSGKGGRVFRYFVLGLCVLFIARPVWAADMTIEMLNRQGNEQMVYSDKLVRIDVGDTITWETTDKFHNVAFIEEAIPDRAEPFTSPLGQDADYIFTVPGVYMYKCTAHYTLGMIGIVVVGDDTGNLESVKSVQHPPRAQEVADSLLYQLEE